jgi:DNA-directed RNA polymerase specialized sigma24 family protein
VSALHSEASLASMVSAVGAVEPPAPGAAPLLDRESREWLASLNGHGPGRDAAIARLHALLLRAAQFEVARRRPTLPHVRGNEFEDIACEAADDALVSVLARLDDFRGASRFTTWVYKFALYEAAAKLRRRAWQGREVPLEAESWEVFADGASDTAAEVERRELLAAVKGRHRRASHSSSADGARRARRERRPDRRARGTARNDPWSALQDASRRAAQPARRACGERPGPEAHGV